MKRVVIGGLLLGVVALVVAMSIRPLPPQTPVQALEPPVSSATVAPQPLKEMSSPKLLLIDSLDLEASIEQVGVTPQGDMAAPLNEQTLGWYGALPGHAGNAVLAGHTGYPDRPSRFRKFEQLKVGDTIEVEDDKGDRAVFETIEIATYTPDDAPRKKIFGSSTTARVVLITCTGTWLPSSQTYSHRFVAYAVRRE